MAYDKKKIFEQAKEAVIKNKLIFIDEVPDFLSCSRSTFYSFYPDGSDELDTLKSLILINKTQIKASMRSKWYKSNAPALQMALYKLIASPDEHKALQMNYTDHTTKGERILPKIVWEDGDTDEL